MKGRVNFPKRRYAFDNLLDNAYFEVAQAGYGGWHGAEKYPADRWRDNYGAGTYEPANPGIKLHYGTNHCYCAQKIANSARLIGKTLTFGVMTDEYGLLLCTGLYTGTANMDAKNLLDTCTVEITEGTARIIVISGTLTVRWAALYPGAYTADTFPTPVPRLYSTELLECQRYFYSFKTGSGSFNGYYSSSTVARFMFNLPVKMRVTPTIFADLTLGNIFPENIVPKELRGAYMTGNMLVCELGVTGGTIRSLICWKPNCEISFISDL